MSVASSIALAIYWIGKHNKVHELLDKHVEIFSEEWYGEHNVEHDLIRKGRERLYKLIEEHDKRFQSCPMADDMGEINTEMAGLKLELEKIKLNQLHVIEAASETHKKLDRIIERSERITSLETRMAFSEKDRDGINNKLDNMMKCFNELRRDVLQNVKER